MVHGNADPLVHVLIVEHMVTVAERGRQVECVGQHYRTVSFDLILSLCSPLQEINNCLCEAYLAGSY